MSENAVIGDKRVLTADFLPNRMVHRGHERQEIADALRPLTEDQKPRNVLLYGPPGTGKSTMARYVVERMQEHMSLASGYANCWRYPSRFKLYHTLLQDMGEKMIHRTGTPTDELVDKFEEKVRRRPAVVVLDEVDQIEDERILYDMVRYNRTGLIMIANNENVFYDLDERIRSSLSSRKNIRFQAYTEEEIMDILRDRRQWGLRDGVINDESLRKIASRANGDARMAINSLRIAAEEAEKEASEQITAEYIEEAVPQARDMNESESLEKLNDDQKILYNVIKEENEIRPRNLYDRYREEVERPKVERTLRNYLQEMEKYRLIESKGKGTGTKYVLKQ
ncbi:Cdc6/Cdc18 family protein [Candidatus Nanosalina sp. VS9-1]|uniref:Cdc6/Cdc18 family protein n=1 Tax=Candidatus Nanosalina sp. VS9-1 TaxID=3388566 RepID=UPI0039E0F1DA